MTSGRPGRTLDLASRGWQWSALFQPGGELVSGLFGRRVQQLALPARPLGVARGMDSRVVHLMDANGEQHAAGWLRTLSATGQFVYSGCYSGVLRTDHELRLYRTLVLRLHYRMDQA